MPTWLALVAWLTCPILYTVALGRHYTRRLRAELNAALSYVDDLYDDCATLMAPTAPTEPIPIPTAQSGRHRLPE